VKELSNLSEPVSGNFISKLCKSAKENNIFVICSIFEKVDNKLYDPNNVDSISNKDNKLAGQIYHVYDTIVFINNKGLVVSKYRKLHLYDALGFKESEKLLAGNELFLPIDSPLGKLGGLICYDLRFPELSRLLALKKSHVLVAPSGWVQGTMKEDHWITLCKSRAIENGVFLLAPNQVGNIFCGRSLVVDPFGIILLDMGNKEGMEIIDIDLNRIDIVRNDLPLLKNRREDIYSL
jgi:predicted amidohydrolase